MQTNAIHKMDLEKIKLIVRNIELLVDSLKTEIYSSEPSYKFDDIQIVDTEVENLDYDEIYEDYV